MRRSTASELRMLREVVWHYGLIKRCPFCKKKLLVNPKGANRPMEFGERSCPPVKTKLAIHHKDGNHSNNSASNRKVAHQTCHKSYHIKQQHKQAKGRRIGA